MSMRPWDDADQAVSFVAILFFIRAAFDGVNVLFNLTSLTLGIGTILPLVLLAGYIAGGAGLLKGQRWAWPLSLVVAVLSVVFTLLSMALLGLLFDALILFLLFRPAVRERFGQLRQQ